MKAITYSGYGPPEVLRVADVPKPVPDVDEVFPMHEAAEAHRRVETEQRRGAVVITFGDSRQGF
ncbi:MAG: zinc-binding dehydrogenase [Myxococcota bacterium]|nr:zinc-binding dehydrogenase [Myxococcota bacterium]